MCRGVCCGVCKEQARAYLALPPDLRAGVRVHGMLLLALRMCAWLGACVHTWRCHWTCVQLRRSTLLPVLCMCVCFFVKIKEQVRAHTWRCHWTCTQVCYCVYVSACCVFQVSIGSPCATARQ
jgi:hypothetical protein